MAIISGVRSVSSTCAVQLESKSYDPDAELYNEEEARKSSKIKKKKKRKTASKRVEKR